jgi:hypothetical protein
MRENRDITEIFSREETIIIITKDRETVSGLAFERLALRLFRG